MEWYEQLRAVLSDYYPQGSPQDVIGYLRGDTNPKVWRNMIKTRTEQMMILGSVPPTDEQWAAAGVANRGAVQAIRVDDLRTFIVTYGGFMQSRPWGKISTLSTDELRRYGITISQFIASVSKKTTQRNALIKAMNDTIVAIENEMNRVSGEHKAQAGLLTGSQGNFSGFFGFWTNHLFNKDAPPQGIWNNCFGAIAHARSTLKEGDFGGSGGSIIEARDALLKASGIYYRWRWGIEGAGTKMQITIGVVGVALIFAAAAATVATAAGASAAAAGAAEGSSATVTVEGLTSLVSKADTLLVRVVMTAEGGVTAPSAVAYEQALEELTEGTEQLLRMTATQ